uniref:SCP domain-containing protein n=1 Tax=Paramormyrops kingsleyae TaxID=1676925 RepID=A0A3B3R1N1_9TELE
MLATWNHGSPTQKLVNQKPQCKMSVNKHHEAQATAMHANTHTYRHLMMKSRLRFMSLCICIIMQSHDSSTAAQIRNGNHRQRRSRSSVTLCADSGGDAGALCLTGHFTQVVWKDSQEMGIGLATDGKGNVFVVAQYRPAGNITNAGYYEQNVLPPQGKETSEQQACTEPDKGVISDNCKWVFFYSSVCTLKDFYMQLCRKLCSST